MKKTGFRWFVVLSALLAVVIVAAVVGNQTINNPNPGIIKVVAAENFWGSLVAQIGGNKAQVLSIVSDPNADPHEYETNAKDATAFANANYVILNGAGYDSWGDKLLAANPNPEKKVLTIATLLGKKNGDNPHFWYSPTYVNIVISRMEQDLIKLAPQNAAYFRQNYAKLRSALANYQEQISSIKHQYAGTEVAATEDIFTYLAQAAGLNLVSPTAFMQAVAEGNDPPASSIVQFEQQLKSGKVKLLVFNTQTVTPLTTSMKSLAASLNIPVVGVSETIQPPNLSFQDWMSIELNNIQSALKRAAVK